MLLRRIAGVQLSVQRGLLRPPINIPYKGIYRKDGEVVRKDELLVVQKKLNYHPGANVRYVHDRGNHLLKSDCDGTVMITREPVNLDIEDERISAEYSKRPIEDLHKFHFNVIPLKMSNRFRLVEEV